MAKVMVVDDSMVMRRNLKAIFLQAGHEVVAEASNGIQAYTEYEKHRPDIVTMDITMPVMNGIDAVDKIIKDFPDAKIIMVSALDQKNLVFQALENGAKHYIIKPITSDKVLSILDEVLLCGRGEGYSEESSSKPDVLNKMWMEIKTSKDEIIELNKSVEERVEERTEELESANSKLKAALEQLKAAQEKLIQSEKLGALGGMVAGIAHEINTPVGVGITAASYLEEKSKEITELYRNNSMKRSDFEKYLNLCVESSQIILSNLLRASELIRSFKQVAVDQSSEEKRVFNVEDYLNNILLSLRPEIKKTNITIETNCDSSLNIESYPGALSQIITNLVMNSIIHGYEEGQTGKIMINIIQDNKNLLFEYNDDGKGMTEVVLDRIFEPFFTTKRNNGGTGLGMNIVYNIVTQKLGGTITCESEPGKGTAFTITVPIEI